MKYKGYFGSVEVSVEDNTLYGKLECINDLVTYEAKGIEELRTAFEEAVEDYIVTCEELGKAPEKTMSGTFNVRIGQQLHKQAYLAAKSRNLTLNDYVKKALENAVSDIKEFHFHIDRSYEMESFTFDGARKYGEKLKWEGIICRRPHH
ncbi:type II toxin-antitoxin system HicB family antitoxin [Klebsiella pneumoniae]|uniref:type II toxin-antitoxin system HicB family antitoxin n=1 Tax=Klebsiella pneumoniae TaxID=573 RepID=UPI001FEDCDE1|nr:type II toxin-antitoxin system HicB family antitoxin [Klebsiella pneumoniae]